ncbi:hypothetical protein GLS40_04400 [Pseudooceanicola sp. 216_PA32_1]|jgi:hypothetical protein|uniref:Lipoprotein n=1 Tax=Pseudooceanicola pacificus TaxID=2676438 RepID=A0A844W0K5_9RHOB|nr:hypothetical protein [Pseudooceanicola pacificus]MWB77257.1 hypothetical protein [Pseudooceanicola pacificus]
MKFHYVVLAAAALVTACQGIAMPGRATSGQTSSPQATTGIPEAAQGRWGLTAADCGPDASIAKGLMVVDGTTLKFYESRATLGKVAERSDTGIEADFAFTGEGMSWTRREVLDLQDGGRTLVRREYGEGAIPGPLRYTACDAV